MEEQELQPRQILAIAALARGNTIIQTAREVGVSEKTVSRWIQQTQFKRELRRLITQVYNTQLTKLQNLLGKGIKRLEDILDDATAQPSDIIRTVHLLLSACDRYQETNLVDRIEDLEMELQNES